MIREWGGGLAVSRATLGVAAVGLLFAGLVIDRAWVSDDAYITFRSVDNFLAGHGLRWNVAERVQAYTHPLWMFLVAGATALSGDVHGASLGLSLGLSFAAVWVLARRVARGPMAALVALAPLIASTAFLDYSTSGLENPLLHFLLAAFLWRLFSDREPETRLLHLSLLVSALVLTRPDAVLLVGPVLAALGYRGRGQRPLAGIALGLLPLAAWECFSVVYYGFPLSNTAYAKLGTGIEAAALWQQGGLYFLDSLRSDPATLVFTGLGIGWAIGRGKSSDRLLATGAILYLLYVATIGGDFMRGRFLAAPLFLACGLLARVPIARVRSVAVVFVAAFLLAAIGTSPPWNPRSHHQIGIGPSPARHGIVDERALYAEHTGLMERLTGLGHPSQHPYAIRGLSLQRTGGGGGAGQALGLYGYYAGPGVHILDVVALTDPLLARLPARSGRWRIGHFERAIPPGYARSLDEGQNRITDPALADYYEDLRRVTRGPLFSVPRWRAIGRLNFEAAPETAK